MNEEIDDSEFYHEDFTTATDWEILVAHIEEVLNQWKSDDLRAKEKCLLVDSVWEVQSENLVYADTNFNLIWYKRNVPNNSSESIVEKSKHVLDKWYDFNLDNCGDDIKINDICLATWYGLNEFIVFSSVTKIGVTNNESKANILLSALTVVVNNMFLNIPMFVQVKDHWQKMYCGIYENEGIRTNFDIVHLKRGPYYCQYLTGLVDLFKTKICSPCSLDNIFVSCQLTYLLKEFGAYAWKQDIFSKSSAVDNLFILPFGVSIDPVTAISFRSIWSCLSEHSIIDSENHSDFNPLRSQKWYCSALFDKDPIRSPICLLADCLGEFLEIVQNTNSGSGSVNDILGDYASTTVMENHPLDLLTESSVPTISSFLSRTAKTHINKNSKGNPPLQENLLVPLLYFLFPDADEKSTFQYGTSSKNESDPEKKKILDNLEDVFKGYKTCGQDSLIWRVSIVLANVLQSLGGLKAFCHIWYEFVQEMRFRWENSMIIPGIAPGMPDLRTCLLNQKLQMLNCCLERKIAREVQKFASAENSEESDDEFFDANDDVAEEKKKEKYLPWDRPVGRLSKFGAMKLLKTGDPLYIPVTQDPVLKTEDQLEEDTDILLKLGTDSEASELRARIMSASLLSDMESFKAANPGSVLEDFIRWYSPRDWIEEDELDEHDQKKGVLSPRMLVEGNIWVEMWDNARPVPAHRQKRLFDDTREAEKVLQYLELMTIGQLVELIIPVLSHVAVRRLIDEVESLTTDLQNQSVRVTNLVKQVERMSREAKFQTKRYEVFVNDLSALELQISQLNSLQYKLNPQGVKDENLNRNIRRLALGETIQIEGKEENQIGSRIVSMIQENHQAQSNQLDGDRSQNASFPVATEREFVLRTDCVRPKMHSAKCPQFLRAIIRRDEFRLVGAFSEDTTFY